MISDFNDTTKNNTLNLTNNLIISEIEAYRRMGFLDTSKIKDEDIDVAKIMKKQKEKDSPRCLKSIF